MLRAASSAGKKRKQSEASSSTDVLPMADLSEEDTRLTDLCAQWPGRQAECTRLFDLLEEARRARAPPRRPLRQANPTRGLCAQPERSMPLFVYGPTGGGKSGVLSDVLASLDVPRAIVDCVACATPRALYETCLNQLHDHRPCEANNYSSWCSCENPAQFVQGVRDVAQERGRVCLVFDRAERLQQQEKLLSTLLTLPTLVSLGQAEVSSYVLPVFVAEALWAGGGSKFHMLTQFRPILCIGFGGYDKPQLSTILKRDAPRLVAAAARGGGGGGGGSGARGNGAHPPAAAADMAAAFEAFLPLFVDFFSEVCQDLLELRYMCAEVFHQWLLPVREGRLAASDTAQLFRESTPHLRRALKKVYAHDGPSPNPHPSRDPHPNRGPNPNPNQVYAHDGSEKLSAAAAVAPTTLRLPTCAKYLLLAAHLASRFPARMDVALFSSIRRGAKQRRTKRNAAHDEPRPFTLERLLTTYAHIQPETELQPLRVEVRRRRGTLHPHPITHLYAPLHPLARARAAQHPHPYHTTSHSSRQPPHPHHTPSHLPRPGPGAGAARHPHPAAARGARLVRGRPRGDAAAVRGATGHAQGRRRGAQVRPGQVL